MFIRLFGWIVFQRKLKFSCGSLVIELSILLTVFNVVCHTWSSLPLGVLCVTLIQNLLPIFLFPAPLHPVFGITSLMLLVGRWFFHKICLTIYHSLLVGHPFTGCKKTLWLAIIQPFLRFLEGKRNKRLFRNRFSSFDLFRHLIISTSLYWYKNKHTFKLLSLSYLHWHLFFISTYGCLGFSPYFILSMKCLLFLKNFFLKCTPKA